MHPKSDPTAIEILDLGPGWMAVLKPSGMSVHNDPKGDVISLAMSLMLKDSTLRAETQWRDQFPPAPVHRLDRETSGILLLATQEASARALAGEFQGRTVRKHYRAILRGQLTNNSGKWVWPLSDKAEGRRAPQGKFQERKPCETRFETRRKTRFASEISIELGTGRQHQIRRHAALSGHEVLGDRRYGELQYIEKLKARFETDRLFLHAEFLSFPFQGRSIEITSVPPEDFEKVISSSPLVEVQS